jgi:hypothetical protein
MPFVRSYIEEGRRQSDLSGLCQGQSFPIYLDGYWQDEQYFSEISVQLKSELRYIGHVSQEDQNVLQEIRAADSIGVHLRSYKEIKDPGSRKLAASAGFYVSGIEQLKATFPRARIFAFSDDWGWVRSTFQLQDWRLVDHNARLGDAGAPADMWLLSRCQHFVLSNSTFSWWAAWLAGKGSGAGLESRPAAQVIR